MASPLEISVVVSTYQRPQHLRRCLISLAAQCEVAGKFEVIIADDGSRDETAELVAEFRKSAPFPLKFCTHPHDGFQLARCRNAGIRASAAPYLLFTDGDCIFPADHLQKHLAARKPRVARAGDCIRIDQPTSERIDEAAIRSGEFLAWIDRREQKMLRKTYIKSVGYQLLGHSAKPKLTGWNMAIWRDDLEQINGFDEKFRGWGCEDDDLATRLRMSGVRVRTALGYTRGYHLWHPPHVTTPQRWNEGPNVSYFQRPLVLPRCLEGIRSRSLSQVSVRVTAAAPHHDLAVALRRTLRESSKGPEIELLLGSDGLKFSSATSQRVLLLDSGAAAAPQLLRTAHATITPAGRLDAASVLQALQSVLEGAPPQSAAQQAA